MKAALEQYLNEAPPDALERDILVELCERLCPADSERLKTALDRIGRDQSQLLVEFLSGLIYAAELRHLVPTYSELLVTQKLKSEVARVEFAEAGPTRLCVRSFIHRSGNWYSDSSYIGPVEKGRTSIPLGLFDPSTENPRGKIEPSSSEAAEVAYDYMLNPRKAEQEEGRPATNP